MTENKTVYTRKAYKDLTFTDDYLFCKILQDDMELCRKLLELLLDISIIDIEHLSTGDGYEILPEVYVVFICLFDFLDYLCGAAPGGELTRAIDESVYRSKTNLTWEREYVLLRELLRDELKQEREEGRREGREEGREERSIELIQNLMESMDLSADQAMEMLKIPEDERAGYLEKL